MEYLTQSAQETQKLAEKIVQKLTRKKRQKAVILALQGELGTGKTIFAQGLARALGVKERVLSPTFVLMKRFTIDHSPFANLYHLDCYRLDKPEELRELGFDEIINQPNNLLVIEWAEKVKKILSEETIWVKLEHAGKEARKIKIVNTHFL